MKPKKTEESKVTWELRDTYKLVLSILGLCLISFSIIFMLRFYRDDAIQEYNGRTKGAVLSIKNDEILTQGFDGQKIHTISYTVTFYYTVDGHLYTNTNCVRTLGNYTELINKVRNPDYTQDITIKYNVDNPQESLILME